MMILAQVGFLAQMKKAQKMQTLAQAVGFLHFAQPQPCPTWTFAHLISAVA